MALSVIGRVRAVPATLIAMYQALDAKPGGKARVEMLEGELLPPSIQTDEALTPVNATLALGVELGLWATDRDSGSVELDTKNRRLSDHELCHAVGSRMFSEPEASSDRKFLLTLAWVLAQPDGWAQLLRFEVADSAFNRQVASDDFRFNNIVFGQTYHWAGWLGALAVHTRGAATLVRADPTPLIARVLDRDGLLAEQRSVISLLDELGRRLPFMDGGWAWNQIVQICPPLSVEEDRVSSSMSFALLRLEEAGVLTLSAPSDAKGVNLSLAGGMRKVSVVRPGRPS